MANEDIVEEEEEEEWAVWWAMMLLGAERVETVWVGNSCMSHTKWARLPKILS